MVFGLYDEFCSVVECLENLVCFPTREHYLGAREISEDLLPQQITRAVFMDLPTYKAEPPFYVRYVLAVMKGCFIAVSEPIRCGEWRPKKKVVVRRGNGLKDLANFVRTVVKHS